MHFNVDSLLALTCLIIASVGLVAGDVQRCDGDERPHPRGLCGHRLAQAHSNLCFLLREVYHREHYHRSKRSPRLDASSKGLVQKIYSIPLDVLADLDLSKDDWHVLLAKKSWKSNKNYGYDVFPEDMAAAAAGPQNRKRNHYHRGMNAFSKRIFRLLKDGSSDGGSNKALDVSDLSPLARSKRTVSSNMVCDCCYNRCSPEELGTYC